MTSKKHSIHLTWERTNLSNIVNMEDCHFYAFTRGNNLLYIGMTWDQFIQKEAKTTLNAFNDNSKGLSIWLGYIDKISSKRLTYKIIRDVEALLIKYHEPIWNRQNIRNYNGRDNLDVKNEGLHLLDDHLHVKGDHIYSY